MTEAPNEDVPYRYRLVATDRTRRELATAFLRWFATQPRTWLLVDLFWVFFALLLFSGMDDAYSVGARVLWSLVFALVPTVLLVVVLVAMIYVRTLRGARIHRSVGAGR